LFEFRNFCYGESIVITRSWLKKT